MRDGDDGVATTTLTIEIEGADDGVTLSGLDAQGGELTVYENDLPLGSDVAPKDALTVNGSFTVNAPDGLAGLTIGTHVFVVGGVYTGGSFQTALGNTFTVTGYNASTGVVSYSYTLNDREQHANGQGENLLEETFAVDAVDRNGSPASGVINVNIVDDVPQANSDTAISVLETGPETSGVNLLANDVKGADGATVTSVTIDGNIYAVTSGSPTTVTVAGVGTFKFHTNGDWSLAPVVNNATTNDLSGTFTYEITDTDGDKSTATQNYAVLNANSLPTAGTNTAVVDDDGLNGGNPSGTDDIAVTGATETVATGTLEHDFNADGPASSDPISFASMHNQGGMVGTEAVTFTWDSGTNTLTASSTARGPIFTVQVDGGADDGTGDYTVTLHKPVLHELGDDENNAIVDLTYTVADSNGDVDDTGTLQITFNDDTPIASSQSVTIAEGTNSKSNVVLVLDRSGSMDEDGSPAAGEQQRIDLMKTAISNLFASGNVNAVFIVSFASSATHHAGPVGGWYTNLASAMQAVNDIEPDGNTNYDAALSSVMTNYTTPPAGGGKTVVMFMSDGEPSSGNSIGTDDEGDWIEFLEDKGIAGSYAFGFGGLDNSDVGYLEPIAWKPGETTSLYNAADTSPAPNDLDDAADDTGVVVISDVTTLGTYLQGTVASSAQGNILDSGTPTPSAPTAVESCRSPSMA